MLKITNTFGGREPTWLQIQRNVQNSYMGNRYSALLYCTQDFHTHLEGGGGFPSKVCKSP